MNVRIIIADVGAVAEDSERILAKIAPCYVKKYQKIKRPQNAQHELISGLLLKKYLGIEKDEQLTYNEYGKPFLVSGEKQFNLSHSEAYVVLAIADCEVGVDVEKLRNFHAATVKRVFNSKQKEEMNQADDDAKDEVFTRLWTECEAVLKLKGTGFAEGWDKEKGPLEKCSMYTFEQDEYFISIATEEKVAIEIERVRDERTLLL